MVFTLVQLVSWAVFGLLGNAWRESNLLGRGYALMDTVSANNPETAIAQYLSSEKSNDKHQNKLAYA